MSRVLYVPHVKRVYPPIRNASEFAKSSDPFDQKWWVTSGKQSALQSTPHLDRFGRCRVFQSEMVGQKWRSVGHQMFVNTPLLSDELGLNLNCGLSICLEAGYANMVVAGKQATYCGLVVEIPT